MSSTKVIKNLTRAFSSRYLSIFVQLSKYNKVKSILLPPIFKRFKKSAFLASLNQNICPVFDSEEIKKQEQQEAIKKLYP